MSRQVNLRLANLRTSLLDLPPILASQLSSQGILPQSLAIELSQITTSSSEPARSPLYLGWSGLTSFSNNDRFPNPARSSSQWPTTSSLWGTSSLKSGPEFIESIELDEALAALMGWKEFDRLTIKFYHRSLTRATTLNVEPLTADDWEILESNPQYLEDNILKQIRVVVESQQLLIWLYDNTLIQVKVNSILPQPTKLNADRARTPYLINNQTEIVVCPKTRFDSTSHDFEKTKQILDGTLGTETSKACQQKKTATESESMDLKILPLAFPLGLDNNGSSNLNSRSISKDSKPPNDDEDQPIALVHPVQFVQIQTRIPTALSSLELLLRPNQALTSKPTLPSTAPPPTIHSRNEPTKNSKPSRNQEPKPNHIIPNIADRVRIVSHSRVPIGFIHLSSNFKDRWFSTLPSALHPRSSFQVGKPGDYEYVRIRPAKIISPDLNPSSSDPSETVPSFDQDHSESKGEDFTLLGFSDNLDFCKQYLNTALIAGHLFVQGKYRSGNHSLPGLMICGSTGSGKTSLVKTLIEKMYLDPKMMTYSRYIDCGKHVDDRLSLLKSNFTEWFDDAAWHSPSVLVLDDLDQLLPAEAEHLDSFRYRHFTEAFISIAKMATKDKLVILVATCSSPASIHNLLRSGTHTFSETLELKGLSRNSRKEILVELLKLKAQRSGLNISHIKPELLCSEKTEGYLPSDLKDLVDRAVHQAIIRSLKTSHQFGSNPISLEMIDFETAQSGLVPISLRDIKLQKSSVNWEDVGGLAETRRILRETLEWPTKYPSVFTNCPLRLRSGLLLYGYPGCGKTLLASAIAKECGLNFINIKGPELLNKYIGASEQSVRDLFQRAQAAQPCVLFFDEFESIAPKRGHDSTGVTDRVVNQLLTQMDGAEGLEGVYVLAATSRPDLIDPALLRPGRLDKSLLCSMPTTEERYDILKAVSRKLPLDDHLSFKQVANLTDGFTGADLQALIYSAHLEVVHESIRAKTETVEQNDLDSQGSLQNGSCESKFTWTEIQPLPQSTSLKLHNNGNSKSQAENQSMRKRIEQVLNNVTLRNNLSRQKSNEMEKSPDLVTPANSIEMRHVQSALRNARPSVPATELARLTKIYRNFVSSRSDGGLPDGEASEEIGGRASLM